MNQQKTLIDVGQNLTAINSGWTFSGDVAEKFDDHINKSIPFYKESHQLIINLTDFFISEDSVCYELGCSTGTLIATIADRFKRLKDAKFIGIDCEQSMINKAKEKAKAQKQKNVQFKTADILAYEYELADLIILPYTAQFIAPKQRQILFNMVYDTLNWGGALILFEKTRAPDARFQDMTNQLYIDYKLKEGFLAHEILAKSRSLKRVLEPFSENGNLDLMKRAGFVDIMTVFKYVNFQGFIAIK
ncbi:methyltransferase domain-containing protein [Wocania ichthyoenteri]|uniref:methyltransferase domain-containing protein n=1 Tax=Wocania ichthyoenteri TaxID=1230531 RepID=UPI00053E0500|nr:methyltransferase domain-containing protein [Wocania ichthyoenteri]